MSTGRSPKSKQLVKSQGVVVFVFCFISPFLAVRKAKRRFFKVDSNVSVLLNSKKMPYNISRFFLPPVTPM